MSGLGWDRGNTPDKWWTLLERQNALQREYQELEGTIPFFDLMEFVGDGNNPKYKHIQDTLNQIKALKQQATTIGDQIEAEFQRQEAYLPDDMRKKVY